MCSVLVPNALVSPQPRGTSWSRRRSGVRRLQYERHGGGALEEAGGAEAEGGAEEGRRRGEAATATGGGKGSYHLFVILIAHLADACIQRDLQVNPGRGQGGILLKEACGHWRIEPSTFRFGVLILRKYTYTQSPPTRPPQRQPKPHNIIQKQHNTTHLITQHTSRIKATEL